MRDPVVLLLVVSSPSESVSPSEMERRSSSSSVCDDSSFQSSFQPTLLPLPVPRVSALPLPALPSNVDPDRGESGAAAASDVRSGGRDGALMAASGVDGTALLSKLALRRRWAVALLRSVTGDSEALAVPLIAVPLAAVVVVGGDEEFEISSFEGRLLVRGEARGDESEKRMGLSSLVRLRPSRRFVLGCAAPPSASESL
jgi:hypothetical protein